MANQITLKVTLDDKGAVKGVKNITKEVEDLKKADSGLDWHGTRDGAKAAKEAGDGYTTLKNVMANLASQGIAMAASGLKNLAASVVEIGSTFETSMSKVSALSGATGTELESLEAKARELGASTTFSASQAADALGYMALAGWDTTQMLDGVGAVLTLAQAGEMDLAAASDLVTDYLSAFGMQADETTRMVDVLAYAQANANTSVEGLGMAFKNCAANAHAAGMDVETTSAAISMLANQGLKGSEAGTALNAVLRDMTAKMEDGYIAIGKTGVAVMDANGNYRDFADIIRDVEAATDGMGDAEKAAALQSTFTADSIKGLNLMLNAGADELVSFRDELYGSAGAGEEMAKVMTDNLGGDLAAMGSAFEELALKIYEGIQVPLRAAVQFISGTVVPALTFLVEHSKYVALGIGAIGAALAALNISKVTSTLAAIPKLIAGFTGGPILAVVAAMAALAAGVMWAYDTIEPFRAAMDLLIGSLEACFNQIMVNLNPAFNDLANSGLSIVEVMIRDFVVPAFSSLAMFILENVIPAVHAITEFIIENVVPAFLALTDFIFQQVVPALADLFNWFTANILPILSKLATFILGTVVPAIMQMVQWFGAHIIPVLSTLYGWFTSNILPILSQLASFIMGTVVPALSSMFGWFNDNIVPVLSTVFDAVSTAASGFASFADTVFGAIENAKNTIKAGIDAIVGFFTGAKFEWPHVPIPHFGINPPGWNVGDLLKGSIPTLSINWYAKGGVFNGPSVIGVGEAGSEAVLPLSNPQAMARVGEAISDAQGGGGYSELVAELRALRHELPQLFSKYCLQALEVNRREFARLVRESEGWL